VNHRGSGYAHGQVSLVYHPLNFLDEASTTNYSTTAAAAAGCAADLDGSASRRMPRSSTSCPMAGRASPTPNSPTSAEPWMLDDAAFAACVLDALIWTERFM
jgi:hypothetical protein